MTSDEANALSAFRESHQGTLSGMTRYMDHLDDMPAIGCVSPPHPLLTPHPRTYIHTHTHTHINTPVPQLSTVRANPHSHSCMHAPTPLTHSLPCLHYTLTNSTDFAVHNARTSLCSRYATSCVALDRIEEFNLLMFGHVANYQSRGTFHSTEQLSLFGSAPANFRSYYTLSEYVHECYSNKHTLASHTSYRQRKKCRF
jgi:hypothetical protein